MDRQRSLGRTVALWCGGLIVVLVVLALAAYSTLRFIGEQQVKSAMARLKAAGVPTSERLMPPPPPADQDAGMVYRDAFSALRLSNESRGLVLNYLSAATREERRALEEQVRAILADNAEALSYARLAAERPRCRFEVDWPDSLQDLWRLVCAQAILRADSGDARGALDAWSLNLSIAHHLADHTPSQTYRYFVLAGAASSLRPILEQSEPSPDDCRRIAQDVAALDLREGFIKDLELWRRNDVWWIERARRNRYRVLYHPSGSVFYVRSGSGSAARLRAAGRAGLLEFSHLFVSQIDEAARLRFWEEYIALARKPYRESFRQLRTVTDQIPRYALMTSLKKKYFRTEAWGRVAARDAAIARVGLMRTALGLAAYRTRFGEYPDSLDALRSALKWAVPEDPFSGKDFVYRRVGSGYLLYSVGDDLRDDCGAGVLRGTHDFNLGSDYSGEPGRDIVWQVER